MVATIDGSSLKAITKGTEYEDTGAQRGGDAWVCGRVTMQQHFAEEGRFDSQDGHLAWERSVHVARRADSYAIAVYTNGSLLWNSGGHNRMLAILGTSDTCIASNPSDQNVALAALDATVHITGKTGDRSIPISRFFLLPGATPQRETVLEPGDLITHVTLPALPADAKSAYLKLRDRASYEFALASAAIVMEQKNGHISFIRVAMGGVGSVPWRSHEAEKTLQGKTPDTANFRAAAEAALHGARLNRRTDSKWNWQSGALRTHSRRSRSRPKERTMLNQQKEAAEQIDSSKIIGIATPRIDGPLKTTGSAMYASDFHLPGLVYAWPRPPR
jgi:CO/xanthine dehydrogenase FAD-binding subunit